MAANIEFNEARGHYSFYGADKPGWHKLGQVVDGARSWEEVRRLANLDFTVSKLQLMDPWGNPVPTWGIFRDDNQRYLGPVGAVYKEIQNEYSGEFLDTLLGQMGGAHYESAGVLGHGQKIWAMARVPLDFNVDGQDPHQTYLLFVTSHDGSTSATVKLTTVRVVCQNTLNAALAMNGVFTKVKHTKDADNKLEAAKKMMGNAVRGVKDLEEKLTTLSRRMLTRDTYIESLDRLFPVPKGKEKESSTRRDNLLADITRLFEHNDGNAFPDFRGTAVNLLNAVTEYTDHCRATRITKKREGIDKDSARTESAIFGSGSDLKENALEILLATTANCATRPYKTSLMRTLERGSSERAAEVSFPAITEGTGSGGLLDSILSQPIGDRDAA